ncbi:hypothetical protein [Cognatishimia sp.]|uniref:hypothetical protein n=1 Tax=Cognatishimia sp. TaxID=2211648 RepID=UPI0035128930|nr:hypothetical protein [Cognatishimia sp.]
MTNTKSETVKIRCVNKRSGAIGAIAFPLKADLSVWLAAGWEEVKDSAKPVK